jgi:hypothetical protein
MDQHQKGAKGGREQLPNGMPIPSMASIIASLSPGQFPLSNSIWKTAREIQTYSASR